MYFEVAPINVRFRYWSVVNILKSIIIIRMPQSVYCYNAASTVRRRQAKTYYVGRLLDLGYSIAQIVPHSSSQTVDKYIGSGEGLTFQTYEHRQLFIEGRKIINSNNCNSDLGVIYIP
jgi:hypothetical protein